MHNQLNKIKPTDESSPTLYECDQSERSKRVINKPVSFTRSAQTRNSKLTSTQKIKREIKIEKMSKADKIDMALGNRSSLDKLIGQSEIS